MARDLGPVTITTADFGRRLPLATPYQRGMAFLIDRFVSVGLFLLVLQMLMEANAGAPASGLLAYLLVDSGYYAGFHLVTGATPGKHLVGIRVASPDGGPVSLRQAVGRWVAFFVGAWIPLTWLANVWVMTRDIDARTLHDQAANTIVVIDDGRAVS